MDRKDFAVRFFQANPKELGYTMLELLFPESIRTFGVDDSAEMAELDALDKEIFRLTLKYIPTRTDNENPVKRRLFAMAEKPVYARKNALNDKRSRMQADEAVKRAGLEDVAVIMGSYHIPLIAEELTGGKTVYVLRPKSLPEPLLEY
jgi:hypothetical protein